MRCVWIWNFGILSLVASGCVPLRQEFLYQGLHDRVASSFKVGRLADAGVESVGSSNSSVEPNNILARVPTEPVMDKRADETAHDSSAANQEHLRLACWIETSDSADQFQEPISEAEAAADETDIPSRLPFVTDSSSDSSSGSSSSGSSSSDSSSSDSSDTREQTSAAVLGNPYSLSDLEQWALANNPSLAAAQAAVCKAEGYRHQVGIRPNPSLGYFGQQLADRGTDQHGLFLEREFVRGDKLRLNRAVLAHTSSAQQLELEAQIQRVLTDVRVNFYETIAAQQQLQAAHLLQEAARRGVGIARDRLKAEEGSRIEVLQSETLLSEITLTVERTEIAYRAAWKELAAVAGLTSAVPVQLNGELGGDRSELDWDSVFDQIVLQSPELSAARAVVCEKAALVQRQQVQAIPNVTAQLGAGYDNGTNSGMINVQVSAPIPTANRNCGNILAANADYQMAVENVNRIEQSIKSRLAAVAQAYESALASVKKYENEIIPQLATGLQLSEAAYQAGELDFLQVLILRRSYFESMIRCIESKSQLAQAKAKIEGLLLTGGLTAPQDYTDGDSIRGATLNAQ